jgi:hypothetical protein
VGCEPKILVFEQAKTVHPLDRAATMIGKDSLMRFLNENKTKISFDNIPADIIFSENPVVGST